MLHHHAYLVEGSLNLLSVLEADARRRFGFEREDDPDVQVRTWETFGIAQSRELASLASLKSLGGRALFVLGVGSMTTEAQQALLKLFEEPPAGVQFVLLAPRGVLLATLRSRFLPYPEILESESDASEARQFLKLSPKERSAFIATILKDEDGARGRVRELCEALEVELYRAAQKVSGEKKVELLKGVTELEVLRSYLSDRAPSLKMILEHLAASLPKR